MSCSSEILVVSKNYEFPTLRMERETLSKQKAVEGNPFPWLQQPFPKKRIPGNLVVPPYRSGILLLRRADLQDKFLTFFLHLGDNISSQLLISPEIPLRMSRSFDIRKHRGYEND
jgi:hypothetical protein